MQRRLRGPVRLGVFGATVAMALSGAASTGAEPVEVCGERGPLVCVTLADTPDPVSPSSAGSARYISYHADVVNRGQSTVTHVTAALTVPAGSTLVSLTPSVGTCSGSTCELGNLASGASASVDAIVTAPAAQGTAVATLSVSFDERFNDSSAPDPKQDTVVASESTGVVATPGSASSYVPQGASVEISTDPTGSGAVSAVDPQSADATVTSSPTAVTAHLAEVGGPVDCPKGVVCRGGDWFLATIPGTFDPPLAFELRWDRALIPPGTNAKKFAVLRTECLEGCPLEVVSARCSSATPAASELPCLWDVARIKGDGWRATLIDDENGFMR